MQGTSARLAFRRYSALFLILLFTLVIAPVTAELRLPSAPVEVLLLVGAAFAAAGNATRSQRWALALLTIAAASLRITGRVLDNYHLNRVSVMLWIALGLAATFATLRFALRSRVVDSEHVAAALSAYLLAGHLFGVAYHELNRVLPISFTLAGQPMASGALDLQTAIYFSFATLTTVGYGDIAPVSPSARGLSVAEAVAGQIYLAVLVARLVGAAGPPSNRTPN